MNLLGPDILCEVVIHVMPDFSRRIYVSKLDTDLGTLAKVVESIIRSGMDLGQQHGITVQLGPVRPTPER